VESTSTPANPIRRLGWITQILGALALLRLIPESAFTNVTWGRDYFGLLGADLVLGFFAFTAGWAFRKGNSWSWAATCLFWGAGTALSAAILIWLGPYMVREMRKGETVHDFFIDSRCLIYALTLTAAPYVLWAMGALPEPQRPSRRTRWSWTLAGVASALAFFFGLIYRA
jgi:hypothetical protein